MKIILFLVLSVLTALSPGLSAAPAQCPALARINQIICHGWPYTVEGVSYPGWSFYAAGAFDESNPWWLVMPDVAKYLQRVSFILRQGTPANDVALLLPNSDAWASLGRNFSLSAARSGKVGRLVRLITEAGYNLDFFDDQLLALRGQVQDHSLAFGEVRYRIIVLPAVERIQPATMKALEQFARAGGIVLATGRLPALAPGYRAAAEDSQLVSSIARRLFKDTNAPGIFLEDDAQLGIALARRLAPDAAMSPTATEIGAVHRHAPGGEVYFVVNTGNQPKTVKASFRVEGMQPELWDPRSGQVNPLRICSKSAGTSAVDLNLPPYGSTIVVFTKRTLPQTPAAPAVNSVPQPLDLSTGWKVTFGNNGPAITMDKLRSWTEVEGQTNFSGVASYEKTVTVGVEMLKDDLTLSLDFGQPTALPGGGNSGKSTQGYRVEVAAPIREAAVLYVNGKRIASVWSPPYSVDVTGQLKAGENEVRIEAANLAVNYLAAIHPPNHNHAGVTRQFGNRFQPQNLEEVRVLPSGLLGPLRLIANASAK